MDWTSNGRPRFEAASKTSCDHGAYEHDARFAPQQVAAAVIPTGRSVLEACAGEDSRGRGVLAERHGSPCLGLDLGSGRRGRGARAAQGIARRGDVARSAAAERKAQRVARLTSRDLLAGLKPRLLHRLVTAFLGDTEIVTLCGSMRFLPQMLDEAAELTTLGVIVLAPFKVIPTGEQSGQLKARLDRLHQVKIALSHRVVIVTDTSRYIGESTRSEIAYAARIGRPVTWAVREGGVR